MMLFSIFATALAALLASAGHAEAGPVFFAVLSAGGGFGAAFAATSVGSFLTTTFTGRLLASVAISALQSALAPKPKMPGITTDATSTGGVNPCGFILGKSATAGDAVCPMMSHGNVGKTPNAYLTYVIALGDIPGQTLSRVAIDGDFVTFDPTADHADYGKGVAGRYRGYAWFKYYDGSQTVADPMLLAKYGAYPERPWQADMIGTGIPYVICTFRYNRDRYKSLPEVLFECGGIKVYDPRRDTTVGGSGAHRWGNAATYEASTNNAVLAYNIHRGIALSGLGVWGGQAEAEDLPVANWFAAMNACDVTVGTPAVAQYQAGMEVRVDMEPASIIEELLKACTGQIAEVGGAFKIRVGGPGLPVMFLTDEDLITTKAQDYAPFAASDERQNGIDAKYPDPGAVWQTKSAPSLYNATWEAEDGDRRVVSLDLPACPYPLQVQRIMASYIKDERRHRKHGITLTPEAAVLEPLDAISWTSARNGYAAKLFELSEVIDDPKTLLQRVSLRECDPTDYDWFDGVAVPTYVPSAVTVVPAPQSLPSWTVLPIILQDESGNDRRPAIKLGWDGADLDAVSAIQFELRIKNGAMLTIGDVVDVAGGSIICAEGILPAVAYQARGKPVAAGRETAWTAWVEAISPDIRLGTPDLTAALNATIDAVVTLAADTAADLDAYKTVTDAQMRNIARAGLKGWVKDPIFADWTSGNLTTANWAIRSGTGTVGSQFAGDFGGGIYINAGSGAAQTYAYASSVTGLDGADPDAPGVVVSMLLEWLFGGTNALVRVGWSNDGTTWTYPSDSQLLAAYNLAVRTGPHQYVERFFARPSGVFSQIRLEVFFKTSAAGAQEQKWHLLNLRAATEAEIRAGNVPTMLTDISNVQTSVTALNGYAAATQSFRVVAGSAGASVELVASDGPGGPASLATIAAKNFRVTAESMLLTGGLGSALNLDPHFQDISAWSEVDPANIVAITDGVTGDKVLRGTTGVNKQYNCKLFNVVAGKRYRIRGTFRKSAAGADGGDLLRIYWYTPSKSGAGYYVVAVPVATTSFQELIEGGITAPAGVTFARIGIFPNFGGTVGYHEWQGVYLEEQIDSSLVVDGSIYGYHVAAGTITTDKMNVAWLNGERISANFLDVDSLLTLQVGAGLRYQKASVTDDGTDGIYFGVDNAGGSPRFGFAASRTNSGKQQSLKLTSNDGLQILNARHFVTGASAAVSAQAVTSTTITLPTTTKYLNLDIWGGGGGGKGGTGDGGGNGANGGNGGNTVVQLYNGATYTGISWTANGGAGGTLTTFNDRSLDGQSSPYGSGGHNTYRGIGGDATGYAAGGGGGGDTGTSGYGGSKGNQTSVVNIDLSAYANPKLVITQGAAGAAGGTGRRGGAGSPGIVNYSYRTEVPTPADVIPLKPTVQGIIYKVGLSITFPDLGAGLWFLFTEDGTSNLDIGWIGYGGTDGRHILQDKSVSFVSEITPFRDSGGFSGNRTIRYAFYSMGSRG
jgi:hypothetical protein